MNLHIITGASKGIGASLARHLISKGDHVVNISRSGNEALNFFKDVRYDLTDSSRLGELIEKIFSTVQVSQYKKITLINNAALIGPVKSVMNIEHLEVEKSIKVNVISPIILSAEFLKQTQKLSCEVIVLNVSSGVAKFAKKSWSTYCISKAAIEMLSESLAVETADFPQIKIVNFEPGIVDTDMQKDIRSSDPKDFADVATFIRFKKEGLLQSPDVVAKKIAQYLEKTNLQKLSHVSVKDL